MNRFLMVVRSTAETKVVLFAREDNRMIVGGVQDERAQFLFAPDDRPEARGTISLTRDFLDHEAAVLWVKQQCRQYAGRDDVDFIEQAEEKKIMIPRGPMPPPRVRM